MDTPTLSNPARVFRVLLRGGRQSRQSLATALNLSVPTISQCILTLESLGLAQEDGTLAATGGRKARLLAANPEARYALGLDVTQEHLTLALVDLAGEVRASRRVPLHFARTEGYFEAAAEQAERFLAERSVPWARVLGVGISMPGIISLDRQTMEYSHILQIEQLSCECFARFLPRPCQFLNDAKAAATAEFWERDEPERALYLSLSNSVGGAIVQDGQIAAGAHHRAGEFGHMTLVPDGRQCYCGKYGCADAYCSAKVLAAQTGGELEPFFAQLREGAPQAVRAWQRYEYHLALLLGTLLAAFDCPVLLGGYIGTHMDEKMLDSLRQAVQECSTFELDAQSIRLCRRTAYPAATGAAMLYIRPFLSELA